MGNAILRSIIGVLVFAFAMASVVMIVNNVSVNYELNESGDDIFVNLTNGTAFINDTYDQMNLQKDEVIEQDIESGEDSWYSMMRGGYKLIKLPFTIAGGTYEIIFKTGQLIASKMGIPEFVVKVFYTVVFVMVLFTLAAYVFRFSPGD